MNAFELFGNISLKGVDTVNSQMKGLQGQVQKHADGIRKAGIAMTALGGIITGVATDAITSWAKMGDAIHKMNLRTGIATETLSKWAYAADLGGTSLEAMEKGYKKLASFVQDAKDGLSTSTIALEKLGIGLDDIEGLSPEEIFMKFAGAVAAVEDPFDRSAIAEDVFGKAGTQLLPMLSEGTEGLKKVMDEAEEFATIFGQDDVNAAAAFTDSMSILKGTIDKVKAVIAENLVPILTPLIEKITAVINKVSEWAKEHPELAKAIIIAVGVLGALMLVLGPLLIILPSLMAGIGILGGSFIALLVPVGLIILAVMAVIAIGVLLYKNWDTIKAKAVEIWTGIVDFFKDIWGMITGIFTDNWKKILLILFPPVGLALLIAENWDKIKEVVIEIWDKVKKVFSDAWETAKEWGINLVKGLWEGIKSLGPWIGEKVKGFAKGIFDEIKAGFGKLWPFSPSEAGVDIGEGLTAGIGVGVKKTLSDVRSAMRGISSVVTPTLGATTPMSHGSELTSGLQGSVGGTTVTISMGNFLGDESSLREFVRGVKDVFNQDVRRTSFSGVNTLGYFPGSSAP